MDTTAPTVPESHRDLLDSPFATLATVGPDRRPQVSEVWFLEGDDLRVSLNVTRQKTKNLMADPGVSLFLLVLANALRYLEVRGDADVAPDEDYSFADRLAAKYGEASTFARWTARVRRGSWSRSSRPGSWPWT